MVRPQGKWWGRAHDGVTGVSTGFADFFASDTLSRSYSRDIMPDVRARQSCGDDVDLVRLVVTEGAVELSFVIACSYSIYL